MEPKNLYYIDAHVHFAKEDSSYLKDVFNKENIIAISNSTNYKDYKIQEELKKENINNLYFANGLYPSIVNKYSKQKCLDLIDKIDYKNSFAIGEIGLDNKIAKNRKIKNLQEDVFRKQLELAEKYKKVVIVHSRYASKKVLDILDNYNVKVLLHWYNGNKKEVKRAIDNGYYITLNYNRNRIIEDLSNLDKILLETDYPVPFYNKSSIKDIKKAYKLFAKKYDINIVELKKRLQSNFNSLFENLKEKYKI